MTGGWTRTRTLVATAGTLIAVSLVLAPNVLIATAQEPLFNHLGDCVAYCARPDPLPTPWETIVIPDPAVPNEIPVPVRVDGPDGKPRVDVAFKPTPRPAGDAGGSAPVAPASLALLNIELKKDDGEALPQNVNVRTQTFAVSTPPPTTAPSAAQLSTGVRNAADRAPTVLSFIEITVSGVVADRIERASITFRLTDDQVRRDNIDIDTVTLLRQVGGEWVALPTEYVSGSSGPGGLHNFRALSPGFSYFAVAAAEKEEPSTVTPPPSPGIFVCPKTEREVAPGQGCPPPIPLEDTSVDPNPPQTPADPDVGTTGGSGSKGIPVPGIALALAGLGVAALVLARRRER